MKINWRTTAAYSALTLALLLTACLLALAFLDWNLLKRPLERLATAHLGREVTVAGPLQVQVWSRTPTVSISELQIGNLSWETRDRFVQIEHLEIQLDLHSLLRGHVVLRRVALVHPEIYLHREKSGRANWTFENTAPSDERAPQPVNLPPIQDAVIDSGKLIVVDDMRRLDVAGTINAHESRASGDVKPFEIQGRGKLNNEPFELDLFGGALLAISPDHPYPFTLKMQAGHNEITVVGNVRRPFDLSGLELQVAARGRDLAELYYLTQIALPNSPPYQVQAHVVRDGQHFAIRDMKGLLGATDIGGTLDVDASRKRPAIVAKLYSGHLFMKDMGAMTGSRINANESLDPKSAPASLRSVPKGGPGDASRLFPDAHLQVDRVQGMDADVTFTADNITSGPVPFTHASVVATLKDGVLTVHPARFEMTQGRVSGVATIDTRRRPPEVHLDLRATDVELEQVKGKAPAAVAPLGGIFDARAIINGRGDSVRSLMANANGTATGVIPHGDIRAAFAELAGVDVAAGIGLLLKKPDDRAAIRCGLAQFDIEDGTARADSIVMDTQNVLITGGGQVELGSEKLNLAIQGHPKKFRLLRVKAPIEIKGHVLKPKFEMDSGHLLKQGGIAAALGTVLTPLAAVLAFVDPGLAKNQDCAKLNQVPGGKPVVASRSGPPPHDAPERVANSLDMP
jgi:AsmA family protein